jgi:hypothetical protein
MSTPIVAALILCLMTLYYALHRIAHAIVTEYGLLGGLITCGAIYAIALIMHRRGI